MSSISVTDGVTTVTPVDMIGFQSTAASQSILHVVLGRDDPDVTLRPPGLRTGTLTYLFADEADAFTCETMHNGASVFTLSDADLVTADMTYILSGNLVRLLDPDTLTVWTVAVDFQEVAS